MPHYASSKIMLLLVYTLVVIVTSLSLCVRHSKEVYY